jgi:hypothetical protein
MDSLKALNAFYWITPMDSVRSSVIRGDLLQKGTANRSGSESPRGKGGFEPFIGGYRQ